MQLIKHARRAETLTTAGTNAGYSANTGLVSIWLGRSTPRTRYSLTLSPDEARRLAEHLLDAHKWSTNRE